VEAVRKGGRGIKPNINNFGCAITDTVDLFNYDSFNGKSLGMDV
jgi:hypothetical protein